MVPSAYYLKLEAQNGKNDECADAEDTFTIYLWKPGDT